VSNEQQRAAYAERAFDLARSGKYRNVGDVELALILLYPDEGHEQMAISSFRSAVQEVCKHACAKKH